LHCGLIGDALASPVMAGSPREINTIAATHKIKTRNTGSFFTFPPLAISINKP
jgi:hypothetical protein